MKKRWSFWSGVLMVGLIFLGICTQSASAAYREQFPVDSHTINVLLAAQTPNPTLSPTSTQTETPETRVLPPVGSNAGLVLGASVLVLIIIGGVVLISRKKPRH